MSIQELIDLSKSKAAGAGPVPQRTVQLQANRTGLYHTVIEFDAGDELAERTVREAVELLCSVDSSLACRIVGKSAHVGVLLNYSTRHGWTPGKGGA
jgi:hypothetical protein